MQRIDTTTNTTSLPTPIAVRTPGYYRQVGDPVQTYMSSDWFNLVQEALCRTIEYSGMTLDKTNFDLFSQALQSGLINYGVTTNIDNAYSVTLPVSPLLTGGNPFTGAIFRIQFNAANTGACTLAINGGTPYFLKNLAGHDMYPGEVPANKDLTLVFDGTNFVVHTPQVRAYAASVYLSTPQAVTGGDTDKVLFDTLEFDQFGLWNNTTKRFVMAASGIVNVSARMQTTAGTSANNCSLILYKNGSPLKVLDEKTWNGQELTLSGDTKIQVAVADYLELYFNTQAGNVDIGGAGNIDNDFQVSFIGSL